MSETPTAIRSSVRTMLTGLIDYAGLFPPAKLEMGPTVRNYARYVNGEGHRPEGAKDAGADYRWAMGRLIVPMNALDEFEAESEGLLPTGEDDEPWRISLLTAAAGDVEKLEADMEGLCAFNAVHEKADHGRAVIDAIELRARTSGEIDEALDLIPEDVRAAFELPLKEDLRGQIAALAGTGHCAKARTGGVTADLIPDASDVARFIVHCARADTPFKATAGLHHPIRGAHRVGSDGPVLTMHGFVNVLLCAGLALTGDLDEDNAARLLTDTNPESFRFGDSSVSWLGRELTGEKLARTRESFFLSFGSCAFDEPLDDLISMKLL